jgi:hypothetical protein
MEVACSSEMLGTIRYVLRRLVSEDPILISLYLTRNTICHHYTVISLRENNRRLFPDHTNPTDSRSNQNSKFSVLNKLYI